MKILFVLDHYYPYLGGGEKLFQSLAESLATHHQVTVVTTKHHKSLKKREVINGVAIERLGINRFLFTFWSLFKVIFYARKCDIIITSSYNAAVPAKIASRIFGKKILIVFHEVLGNLWFQLPYLSYFYKAAYFFYERFILSFKYDKLVAVSQFTRERLIQSGHAKEQVKLIYNGLDYNDMLPYTWQPPDSFTFTYFGRIGLTKGLEILLESATKFTQKYPDVRVKLIIPTYPENVFHKVIKEINKINVKDNITVHHNLSFDELMQEICTSSCIVIPSRSEGFCYTALEASAIGIPIISSHRGALPETVSGTYIALKELDAENLYRALVKAYKGQWHRTAIKRFELEDMLLNYNRLIHQMLYNDPVREEATAVKQAYARAK